MKSIGKIVFSKPEERTVGLFRKTTVLSSPPKEEIADALSRLNEVTDNFCRLGVQTWADPVEYRSGPSWHTYDDARLSTNAALHHATETINREAAHLGWVFFCITSVHKRWYTVTFEPHIQEAHDALFAELEEEARRSDLDSGSLCDMGARNRRAHFEWELQNPQGTLLGVRIFDYSKVKTG